MVLRLWVNVDFPRAKIDLVELCCIKIPNGVQLGRPMRTRCKIRFVVRGEIKNQLSAFELEVASSLLLAVLGNDDKAVVLLWVFL
jgi:hypothetical protein